MCSIIDKGNLRLILNSEFKKKIFEDLFRKYSSLKCSKILNISRSMLYHYKNNRVKSVPLLMIEKIKRLLDLKDQDINKNIINILKNEEIRDKGLIFGRKLRIKEIKEKFTINISITDLLKKNKGILSLNLVEWLEKTDWINKIKSQKGLIKNVKKIKFLNEHIKVEYEVYKKSKGFEKYNCYLPKNIILDKGFFYFLGLKFGDGTSGSRLGIANKDYFIIKNSFNFLKNIFPKSRIHLDLHCYKKSNKLLIQKISTKFKKISNNITVYHNPKTPGDFVFFTYVTNRIFSRVLDSIIKNLKALFQFLSFEQKGAFFAGFFDAEGNVNKLDENLRFSQKIKENVEIMIYLLKKEGYHVRYDGSNIVIAHKKEYRNFDLTLFEKQILPFIESNEKSKESAELINGYLVRACYKPLAKIISENPGITQREIADILGKAKCNAQLRALEKAGFIKRERRQESESFKNTITSLGLKWQKGG